MAYEKGIVNKALIAYLFFSFFFSRLQVQSFLCYSFNLAGKRTEHFNYVYNVFLLLVVLIRTRGDAILRFAAISKIKWYK